MQLMYMKATIFNDLAVVQSFHEKKHRWWKNWLQVTTTMKEKLKRCLYSV